MSEKMTNADRIKKATDKELADMLCKITRCCSDCIAQEMCYEGHTGYEDWLASEEWSDFSWNEVQTDAGVQQKSGRIRKNTMPGWQSIHRIGKPVRTSAVRHTRIIQWRMH